MEKKNFLNRDRIAAFIWLAVAAYIWYEATTYPQSMLDAVGPAKYPHLLSALIAIGAVGLFITGKPGKPTTPGSTDVKSMLYVIGDIVIYLALFNLLGFILSTIIFLMAMCMYFDTRELKTRLIGAVPYSVGFTIIIYLFFAKALGVQLPTLFL